MIRITLTIERNKVEGLPQFKTVAALVKSYKELQVKLTKTSQELKAFKLRQFMEAK